MEIENLIPHLRNRGITKEDAQIIAKSWNRYRTAIAYSAYDYMKIGFHGVIIVEGDGSETFHSGHHKFAQALIDGYESGHDFYIN